MKTRAYGGLTCVRQADYPMDVVWHDYEFVERNVRVVARQSGPLLSHDYSVLVQLHLSIHYFAKNALPVRRANSHEICAWLGVIVFT